MSSSSHDAAESCLLGKLTRQTTRVLKPERRRIERNTLFRSPLFSHNIELHIESSLILCADRSHNYCNNWRTTILCQTESYFFWQAIHHLDDGNDKIQLQRSKTAITLPTRASELIAHYSVRALGNVSRLLYAADSPIPRYCQNSSKMLLDNVLRAVGGQNPKGTGWRIPSTHEQALVEVSNSLQNRDSDRRVKDQGQPVLYETLDLYETTARCWWASKS